MLRSSGICWRSRLVFMGVFSMSIDKLHTDLLGESELHVLASRSSKLCDALLRCCSCFLNLWDSDTLLSSQVFTGYSYQGDWLVDTGLDWLRVGNLNCGLGGGNNGDIVASLLGNLLAVVVSVAVVSVSWGWLTDGDHLGVAHLLVRNLNSLGGGTFSLLLVRVSADLIVND